MAGRPVKNGGQSTYFFSCLYLDDFFNPFLNDCKKCAIFNEIFLPHLYKMIYKKGIHTKTAFQLKTAAMDVVLKQRRDK
jgi:hypothetical protein